MPEKQLRVAVIGLDHGLEHIGVIAHNPRARLTAVVDREPKRRASVAAQHGVPGFASAEELVASHVADAVAIAVPTPAHAAVSCACLDGQLHVLQEKPLCCTDAEAALIAAAIQRSGRIFQLGYEVRSSVLHQSILEHIRRGDLGTVTNVWYNQHTCEKSKPGDWRQERSMMGGKLFDCAVHYLDLMQQWAGAPVHRVAALGHALGKTGPCQAEIPESAGITVEYRNGVHGTFNFGSSNILNDDASFGIVGTTGRIMGNPWLPEGPGSFELRRNKGMLKGQVIIDGALHSAQNHGHLGTDAQWEHFIATIFDGAPNVCSFEDALAIHHQMMAIDRSLSTGTVVTLDN